MLPFAFSAVILHLCSWPLLAFPQPYVPHDLTVDSHAKRPNILILLIDDMGYSDLASFGSPNVSTPNLDKLVKSGMKFTQWISGASICTPSRAALQTGRYPVRTGCVGNVEQYRVIPTPSSPGGLDPAVHMSLATALRQAGYTTGMSGKWHLGINGNGFSKQQDFQFTPTAHSYQTYVGAPYTNAPMCAMDSDGISQKNEHSPGFCFLMANTTVVQQPLRLENFTASITAHALDFLSKQAQAAASGKRQPWYFLMSYFHVHTPLFTNRTNRGRSAGGAFGDNVEELDDSVGEIIAALQRHSFENDTLIFMTSDNGPYQEEGWAFSGRTAMYDPTSGKLLGRLKGGKGQVFEGGIRMPGAVVWPNMVQRGVSSDTMVSTIDIFPTALAAAGIKLGSNYSIDGKDMTPILLSKTNSSQHEVFFHYCGFEVLAARVWGRWKVFWATQKWYTNDKEDSSICTQCCNGINPWSRLTGTPATELCGCQSKDMIYHKSPIVYDMTHDPFELHELSEANWPGSSNVTYQAVIDAAETARKQQIAKVHPKPSISGAGTCTKGTPARWRQPCCPGCHAAGLVFPVCKRGNSQCTCDNISSVRQQQQPPPNALTFV